jgi:hypothetical protein
MNYLQRDCITTLNHHHYDTRGIVRTGVNPIDARVNTGPNPQDVESPIWNMADTFAVPRNSGDENVEAKRVIRRRPYVSIDIETTGVDYEYCQILEFGAVIDDWVTPLDKLPRFHAYLIHDRIQGEPFALAMNAEILRRLANRDKPECAQYTFVEPKHLAGMFSFWAASWKVGSSGQGGKSIIPAGKNFAGFDRPFLKRLPEWSERVNILHRCIDPAMIYWNPATDTEPPSTQECYNRAVVQKIVAHNAVDDAIGIIQLIRAANTPINVGDIDITINAESDPKGLARRLMSELRRTGCRI